LPYESKQETNVSGYARAPERAHRLGAKRRD